MSCAPEPGIPPARAGGLRSRCRVQQPSLYGAERLSEAKASEADFNGGHDEEVRASGSDRRSRARRAPLRARRRSSCAGEVGQVNDKVDTLWRSVEETQERTRANEGQITEVDQRAQAAAQAARGRADEAYSAAGEAATKADTIEKASKRLVYEVVLSEDKGNFKFGRAHRCPTRRRPSSTRSCSS